MALGVLGHIPILGAPSPDFQVLRLTDHDNVPKLPLNRSIGHVLIARILWETLRLEPGRLLPETA